MTHRRDFLKLLLSGSAIMAINPLMASQQKKRGLGIITNTLGDAVDKDYKDALRQVADMGYEYIESGIFGDDGVAYRKFLRSLGLKSVATGTSMGGLQKDLGKYIQTAEELEAPYITCYWPWLSSAENLTRDEVMQTAERLNEYGQKIKDAGFKLCWHNHDKEFVDIEGKLAFDHLMDNTDPDMVTVQLDWYWVVKGGSSVVDLFHKYPGRFELAHVKDMTNNNNKGIACVGNGIMELDNMMRNASTGGTQYFIVENEQAVKGMKCARESYDFLKKYF